VEQDDVTGERRQLGGGGGGEPGGVAMADASPLRAGAGDLGQHERGEAGRGRTEREDEDDVPAGHPAQAAPHMASCRTDGREPARQPGEPRERRDRRHRAGDREPAGAGGAEGVGGEPDGRRPGHAAECVPDQEPPPGHPVSARQPRGGDPADRDPAAEEHCRCSVGREEAVAGFQEPPPAARQRSSRQQRATAELPA
jgi:hypothetical protein